MNTKLLAVFTAALIQLPVLSSTTFADADSDKLYNSARNQLGLIKYCIASGHISADATAGYEKIIAVLPVAADSAESDKYEAEGANGNSYDGTEPVSIEQIATATGSTIAAHCAQYEALTKQ